MLVFWRYLKTVLLHRSIVQRECRKAGIPSRGLWHDISKFRPDEFIPYARYYGLPMKDRPATEPIEFSISWKKHNQRCKHHWQWWIVINDDGTETILPMDEGSRLEMLCDWRAMGYQHNGYDDAREYYLNYGKKFRLHNKTRAWVEEQLDIIEEDKEHWGPGTWYKCPGCNEWDNYDNPKYDMFFPVDNEGPMHHKCYG